MGTFLISYYVKKMCSNAHFPLHLRAFPYYTKMVCSSEQFFRRLNAFPYCIKRFVPAGNLPQFTMNFLL